MAFNVPNWGTISGGQSFPVAYTFGGANHGAQFAEGSPQNPGAFLISDQEGISTDNGGGITYQFQLTCFGNSTVFSLDGGGLG